MAINGILCLHYYRLVLQLREMTKQTVVISKEVCLSDLLDGFTDHVVILENLLNDRPLVDGEYEALLKALYILHGISPAAVAVRINRVQHLMDQLDVDNCASSARHLLKRSALKDLVEVKDLTGQTMLRLRGTGFRGIRERQGNLAFNDSECRVLLQNHLRHICPSALPADPIRHEFFLQHLYAILTEAEQGKIARASIHSSFQQATKSLSKKMTMSSMTITRGIRTLQDIGLIFPALNPKRNSTNFSTEKTQAQRRDFVQLVPEFTRDGDGKIHFELDSDGKTQFLSFADFRMAVDRGLIHQVIKVCLCHIVCAI